ncbi:MAG TPA: hypothetical protein VKV20_08815 [Ktedonobacteraceae bacterium]|jgi:hypothetical protein|nr:hypothetical protein [Ktedonobacteraceae bacterium]
MGPGYFKRPHPVAPQGAIPGVPASSFRSRYFTLPRFGCLLMLSCIFAMLFTACDLGSSSSSSSSTGQKASLSTGANGTITYSTNPQDVLIRTFYGGGNLGSLEMSPDISIYGDGTFILGPGLQMQEGKIGTTSLQQLLHTLVDSDSLLKLSQQTFYDIPDQNATVLLLSVNGKQYQYIYGPFGNLPESESAQALADYKSLGSALTSIQNAVQGPLHPYTSQDSALLVHQDFNPNLTQNIPTWSLNDFTLYQAATFECGIIPQDITSPNADTGCLTYTVPHTAILLNAQQRQAISRLLNGQQEEDFQENGLYYQVMLRPLLPDELLQQRLAMYGSGVLNYTGVPLHEGAVPTPQPTPTQ